MLGCSLLQKVGTSLQSARGNDAGIFSSGRGRANHKRCEQWRRETYRENVVARCCLTGWFVLLDNDVLVDDDERLIVRKSWGRHARLSERGRGAGSSELEKGEYRPRVILKIVESI